MAVGGLGGGVARGVGAPLEASALLQWAQWRLMIAPPICGAALYSLSVGRSVPPADQDSCVCLRALCDDVPVVVRSR